MATSKIETKNVTKPIQLLAAWLIGLILVNSSFLAGAASITSPDWAAGTLVIAAICNVPLFLISIFVLQTKFRPEMQEDSYYSKYLESRTGESESVQILPSTDNSKAMISEINHVKESMKLVVDKIESIENTTKLDSVAKSELEKLSVSIESEIEKLSKSKEAFSWSGLKIQINRNLKNNSKIKDAFLCLGIAPSQDFGPEERLPNHSVISIGLGFEIEHIRKLFLVIKPFNFEWLDFVNRPQERDYSSHFLIGSYVKHPEVNCMKINDALISFINREDTTTESFYEMLEAQKSDS